VDRVPGVLTFDDLRAVSRLGPRATLAKVERWARSCGIRYKHDGRGGIWTTVDALNQALGIVPAQADGAYSPDLII
jgi:hypothetical protein